MADFLNPTTLNQTTKDKIDESVITAGNPQAQLTPNLLKGMVILDNMVRNNMIQDYQNQQLAQQEQQPPALQRGLLYPVEKVDAMIQGRPDESVQQEIAQQQPRMTLNQLARRFANDVIDSKLLWEEGAKAGNEQVMQLAHNGAEQARAGLQQLGYDPQAYGLNDDLAAAQQNLARNDLQALQNTLYGEMAESSGARFRRLYNVLLDRGVSHDIAKELAAKHSSVYSDNRKQALTEAFHTYGHDNTTINPMGEQLLEMIADEDIQAAEGLAKPYANPLNEYGKQNAIDMAAIAQANHEKNAAIGQKNTLEQMGIAQEYRKELKDIEFQMQEAHADNDVNRKFLYQSKIMELQNKYGVKENKNGITHEKAEVARKAITDIDKKLNEDFTLTDEEKKKLRNDRANYQYILDTYFFGGQGDGSNNSNSYGVNVNDYDSLRAAYQQMINENAAREAETDPVKRQANPPRTRAQLEARLRLLGGENNPLVENIIANANYDGDSGDTANQPASAPSQAPASPTVIINTPNDGGYNVLQEDERGSGTNFLRGVFNLAFPHPSTYMNK